MESPGGSGYCLSNGGGVRGWFYKTKPPTAGFWIGNRFEPENAPLINVPMGNTKQTHRGERSPGIVTETPLALFTKRTRTAGGVWDGEDLQNELFSRFTKRSRLPGDLRPENGITKRTRWLSDVKSGDERGSNR